MAKETKEQKALRLAVEEQAREAETAAFRATLPKRLFEAQCMASMLPDLTVSTTMTAVGPSVRFHREENPYIDTTLTYQSDEWEVILLEDSLKEMKAEQDARAARRKLAQEIFDGLSPESKQAIKENIYLLR